MIRIDPRLRKLGLCAALLHSSHSLACVDACQNNQNCLSVQRSAELLGCGDDYPFLDPYNDSRTTLRLLYSAKAGVPYQAPIQSSYGLIQFGTPPEQALDEQTQAYRVAYAVFKPDASPVLSPPAYVQCAADSYAPAIAFFHALAGAGIDEPNKRHLADLRNRLLCTTVDSPRGLDLDKFIGEAGSISSSTTAKAYSAYLRAAAEFYWARYDNALTEVEPLIQSDNDWIRQTSMILKARVYMVRAQQKFQGYTPDRSSIDAKDLQLSGQTYQAYLDRFPTGLYSKSAQGMLRRVQYLSGNDAAYQALFLEAWGQAERDGRSLADLQPLIDEAEQRIPYLHLDAQSNKPSNGITDDPLLLAAGLIASYRAPATDGTVVDHNWQAEIEKHKAAFDTIPGLTNYLLMADADGAGAWDRVVALNSQAPRTEAAVITPARKLLTAMALEHAQHWNEALATWASLVTSIQEPAQTSAEAGYVRTALEASRPNLLWSATGSLSASDTVPVYAVRHLLSVEQLESALKDSQLKASLRPVVTETLLMRYALDQQWDRFLMVYDRSAEADRASVAPLETAARTLAVHANDPKALLNAGFFFIDRLAIRDALEPCHLAPSVDVDLRIASASDNPPPRYDSPLSYFTRALDQHPGGELEAKLLYHGIKCFSPAWHRSCLANDNEIPTETREQWFHILKSKYGNTEWAQKARYWW